jgi:hypothetical protein
MRNCGQYCLTARIMPALFLIASIGTAFADDHGYRTGTFVESDRNECRGVPDCASTTSPHVKVGALGRKATRVACPQDHPNFWAWDSGQHEHILVRMVAVDRWTVTVEGVNATDVPGEFSVSLGCSTQPYKGNGIQLSRQLAPTSQLPPRQPMQKAQATPVPAKTKPKDGSGICDNIPFCQEQPQTPGFVLSGWQTDANRYTCQAPYLYAWPSFTYEQSGYPSVSAIGANFEAYPSDTDLLLTNWNLFQQDTVYVQIACSKSNYWTGNTCGNPQDDPGCPVVSGSSKTYCSRGPVPVCFGVYQERCAPRNQLYSCTNLEGFLNYCQPCPG